MVRVAINGFGRIGRLVLKAALYSKYNYEFVAINDLGDPKTMLHLFKYDSNFGRFKGEAFLDNEYLVIRYNNKEQRIKMISERNLDNLPWRDLNIDVVIESTGLFTHREFAKKHLEIGAKKVIISAPSPDPDITIVKGVNEHLYDFNKHNIISNASCTTNSIAPVIKVLNDNFGVERGFLTTVHSYTNDQKILDLPHKDLRRARAAALSMIPTTTGAAKAVTKVIPELTGKLDGIAIRVPTPVVSITDFVGVLKRDTSVEEVNELFRNVANYHLKDLLEYSDEPLVSRDFVGDIHSSIVDALSTKVNKNLVKILAWYDNEWGYSNRVVDLINIVYPY